LRSHVHGRFRHRRRRILCRIVSGSRSRRFARIARYGIGWLTGMNTSLRRHRRSAFRNGMLSGLLIIGFTFQNGIRHQYIVSVRASSCTIVRLGRLTGWWSVGRFIGVRGFRYRRGRRYFSPIGGGYRFGRGFGFLLARIIFLLSHRSLLEMAGMRADPMRSAVARAA
jgi:hypothetical protein